MAIPVQGSKRLLYIFVTGLAMALLWLWLPQPARADSPVFVRAGGSDTYCVGIADVDFSPGVAPACAVQTVERAEALAGPNSLIFVDSVPLLLSTSSDDLTIAAIDALSITKIASSASISATLPLTYTIYVTNRIGIALTNSFIIDSLPGGAVLIQSIEPAGICTELNPDRVVYCPFGELGALSSVSATIVVTPVAAGQITNDVSTKADGVEQAEASVSTQVQGTTELEIRKTAAPTPALLGQPLTYTLTVSNNSSLAAATVVITDRLPASVTVNQPIPGCDPVVGGVLTCTLPVINANAKSSIFVKVTPNATGVITNTASVSGGGTDPITSNNTSTITTTVVAAANLSITKADAPDPVKSGAVLTYTLVVRNGGPSSATGVTLTDDLPAKVTLLPPASPSQGTCGSSDPLVCNLGTLAAGGAATVTVRATVQPTASGVITNTASVTSAVADPSLLNNSATVTTTVQTVPVFTISKSAQPASGSNVEPYDTITYSVVVKNLGLVAATNTVITDDLQLTAFDFVTATLSNGGSIAGPDPLLGNVGTLAAGQSVTMTVVVNVNPVPAGTVITNSAVVGGDDAQTQTSLQTTHVVTSGLTPPSFSITKSAQPPGGTTVAFDDIITYTVRVANSGGGAFAAIITDTIPTSTTYVAGSAAITPGLLGTASLNGSTVVGQIPYFLPSSVMTLTFRVQVATRLTYTISNQARLDSSQTPLQTSNVVTHPVQATPAQPSNVYLPIILKNYASKSASMYWDSAEPVRDKVRDADGAAGLVPDGANDGVFRLTLDLGSEGPLTVVEARLESTQRVIWDTITPNAYPVLGIFNGGIRLNAADGTVTQSVDGLVQVSLYAADDAGKTRFVPELYTYYATIYFSNGSSVTAEATIPPPAPTPTPTPIPAPTPTPEPCAPEVLASVTVGNTPRGVAVDTARSNRAYVANYGSSSVSVVQGTAVVSTVSGVTTANGIAYDPTNDRVWVTNESTNQVTPINAATLAKLTPIGVGSRPWGVVHNTTNNYVYVVNRDSDSVTVINGATLAVVATLSGGNFNEPTHVDFDAATGKVYVVNYAGGSVTVIEGTSVSKVVSLYDSSQPYGIAVDSLRHFVYVTSVDSHRITMLDQTDSFYGWAAFHRGFNDPTRPVPLREIAINPDIGDSGDGGHLWTSTSTNDGSEKNEALLVAKGGPAYYRIPVAREVGSNPGEGAAVDRVSDRAYITSGASPGTVTIFQDRSAPCLEPFNTGSGSFGLDLFVAK